MLYIIYIMQLMLTLVAEYMLLLDEIEGILYGYCMKALP